MRLTVLDDVTWDGAPIRGSRAQALLRSLVQAGPRGMSELSLVEDVWGAEVPDNPISALQVVISRVRSATDSEAIERTATGYRLALETTEVDAWALRPEGLRLAAAGDYRAALALLQRVDSEDEEVVAARLRAEAAVYGLPHALSSFEEYRLRIADTLGIDPSPALRQLHAELLARDRPIRSGLDFDADPLIGRGEDIAALSALVRTHRLVSIVGAGGLGKTRLARIIARDAEQPIVHFVELAGVSDADGVALAVADALGLRETFTNKPALTRQIDVMGRFVEALGETPTLLVLDNCEHVVAAVADLVSLLVRRASAVTVLTTTRIGLGLRAERVYLLPELPLDDAVALFRERGGARYDDDEVRALVARLDGLPLAVELAAAKVRTLGLAEVTRRLEDRFSLLRGGSRDAPERHQTLLAVIDWSWNLLTAQEQAALRQFAAFRSDFSVASASELLGHDAAEVVASLVDQSLVSVYEVDAITRYRLLETVREFGLRRLGEAGEEEATRARVRQWAVGLCEASSRRLHTRDQVEVARVLRVEEANLVDVLRRGVDAGDVQTAATIFVALADNWSIQGTHIKVVRLADRIEPLVLSTPLDVGLDQLVRVFLSISVRNAMVFRGTHRGVALDRLAELGPGDETEVAATIRLLLGLGDDDQHATLEAFTDHPDRLTRRGALLWLAHLCENSGDLDGARAAARRALELCEPDDGPWIRTVLLTQLSNFALHGGLFDEAVAYGDLALAPLRSLGAMGDYCQTLAGIGLVALQQGRYADAERILAEAEAEEISQSVFGGALTLACGHAELLIARGQVDEGLAAYVAALDLMGSRGLDGSELLSSNQAWTLFPQAALVAAATRHGRAEEVRVYRGRIRATLLTATDVQDYPDIPVLGSAIFSLAVWQAAIGDREHGAWLLACAERFSFSCMLPSMDGAWARDLCGPSPTTERRSPQELLPAVCDLLQQLA